MTKRDFLHQAILGICGNASFGNGHGSFVDYQSWARRITEAAEALTYETERLAGFDEEPDKPP